MHILTAAQTHALDQATTAEQGLTSLELMERAATAATEWLLDHRRPAFATPLPIFCGPGNNGGDGLAVARQLHALGYAPTVWLLPAARHSADFQANRRRLPDAVPCHELAAGHLPALPADAVVVDALFGTGLSRPLTDLAAAVVAHLNESGAQIVAVDLPSGLLADAPQPADAPVVRARHTISFGLPKLAFLLPQNADFVGRWHVLPIGLSQTFIDQADSGLELVDAAYLAGRLPRRATFAHKGTYGHALLLAGSRGKIGAAVLAARACLCSGVGLLTVRVPAVGYDILQTTAPEAMALPDPAPDCLTELPEMKPYSAVGIGPGLGQEESSRQVLAKLLRAAQVPLVLDADALNMLGAHPDLLALLPPDSLLTPHPKEFERLARPARDDYHRLDLLRAFCRQHRCYVVLKGAYTCLGTPEGPLYFNSTGNPGMATGGSGDVLTGVLTALRAQKNLPVLDAALLGIYAHGRAGDLAARHTGQAGLVAGDIVQYLGPAFEELTTPAEF